MIPIQLHLSGFLSYLDPVDIDFESFDLACISGQNGAGKSSLLDAITWALFGEARRRDDSIINSQADAAEVIFIFEYEGSRYKVQRSKPRGKSTLLEFRQQDVSGVWKPLTEATLSATNQRIVDTLRLDYETFINASFFLQGKADRFATQRPSDRKHILSNTLGLEIWETYKEEALRRRRSVESTLALKESLLKNIEEELAQEDERKRRLAEAEKEHQTQKSLADAQKMALDQQRLLHERFDREAQQLQKQQNELERLRQELDRQNETLLARQEERSSLNDQLARADEIQAAVAEWKCDQKKLEEWDNLAGQVQALEARRNSPLQEIAAEKSRLETLLQQYRKVENDNEALRGQLSLKKKELADLEKNLAVVQSQIESKPALENDLRVMANNRASLLAENQSLRVEMDQIKERQNRLSAVEGANCPLCGKPLSEHERSKLLDDLQLEGTARGDAYRKNQLAVKESETRYRELENQITSIQQLEPESRLKENRLHLLRREIELIEEQLSDWQAAGMKEMQSLAQRLETADYAQEARKKLAAIEDQMKALGYDPAAHAAVREKEKNGRASQEALLTLETARARLEPLQREIETLHQSIERQEEHMRTLSLELTDAQKVLQQNRAALSDLSALESDYYLQQEKVNSLLQVLAARRNDVLVLKNLKEQKKTLSTEKETTTRQINQLKLLEHAFGKDGIPALLIEQSLPEIESDANEILERLSDGNMSVRFETQREYKDKKRDDRKETLDIIIHDSNGDRDYELFSGGEAFRINFAIRLALSRVLARRSGARLQTLVIDEGFGSQDAEGVQRLIEAINNVRGDFAKILVITHMEELKDAFSARIEVTKTARGSRVQVVAA